MHRPTLQLRARLQRIHRRLSRTEKSVYGYVDLGHRRTSCHVMDQHNAEVGIFITIEPVTARMRQEAQNMGSFEHNHQTYPRLQFWQIDDTYFENPDVINSLVRLPDAWRIRPTQKSERHFDNRQIQFLRG